MNSIGFIKEYDQNHVEAVQFDSIQKSSDQSINDERLFRYLRSGVILVPMLHWVDDLETGAPIGPHIIHTDGSWIWPSYLVYYLEKGYDVYISDAFISHVKRNEYHVPVIDEEQLKEVARYYFTVTNQPIPRGRF